MNVALLHYWLTNVRGGEKVLAALGEMFPEADVFTHAYVPGNMEGLFDGRRVMESFIARLPLGRRHPQAYLPLKRVALLQGPVHGRNAKGPRRFFAIIRA